MGSSLRGSRSSATESDELEAALREGLAADLLVTSGGLGPTHDDRTVELLARVTGRELRVDDDLHAKIERVSRGVAERLRRPYADFEPGVRKQASVPDGAASVGLAGTAPGLVLEHRGTVVVVLPGPPGELQRLWASAVKSEPMLELLARARPPGRRVLRLFGVSESAVARALEEAGGEPEGVEATICARDFEIHVDLVVDPGAEARGGRARVVARRVARALALRQGRADDRGARARALPRARAHARDGRVLHGRSRGGAADARARLERRLPRCRSSPTRIRSRRRSWAFPRR